MRSKLLKSTVMVSILTITASLFAGCTPTAPATTSAGGSQPAGSAQVVKYNLGADPKTLDPALNTAVEGGTVLTNLLKAS